MTAGEHAHDGTADARHETETSNDADAQRSADARRSADAQRSADALIGAESEPLRVQRRGRRVFTGDVLAGNEPKQDAVFDERENDARLNEDTPPHWGKHSS
ncbi:hypothetical protein [Humidisolicoccus flavus]|uniref:hypothetical protein n=1 Tax=Humidisolicoccus flavus TaxID=3111414 RepID=UPI003246403F